MVLGKPFLRRADGADDFRAQILFAADPVVDFFRERIVKKPVDGEIAAERVGFRAGENDFLRPPAVAVFRLGAKGGDLELLLVLDDDHHPEFFPDWNGFLEKFFNLLRSRVGGNVVILRLASEQKIAHAAADPERGEAGRLQAADNFSGGCARRSIHAGILPQTRNAAKPQPKSKSPRRPEFPRLLRFRSMRRPLNCQRVVINLNPSAETRTPPPRECKQTPRRNSTGFFRPDKKWRTPRTPTA